MSDEGLPEGWSSQLAPNERMFFIDHVNKTTSWVDPRTGCETENPEITEDELGPLPDGWGKRIYADGRVFFVDHNSRLTQVMTFNLSTHNIVLIFIFHDSGTIQDYKVHNNQQIYFLL